MICDTLGGLQISTVRCLLLRVLFSYIFIWIRHKFSCSRCYWYISMIYFNKHRLGFLACIKCRLIMSACLVLLKRSRQLLSSRLSLFFFVFAGIMTNKIKCFMNVYVISDSGVVHRWHLSNNERFKLNIGTFFTPAQHLCEREQPHQTSWAVPVQVSALHWARSDCWHPDGWSQVWWKEAGTRFWFLHNYPAIRAKQK